MNIPEELWLEIVIFSAPCSRKILTYVSKKIRKVVLLSNLKCDNIFDIGFDASYVGNLNLLKWCIKNGYKLISYETCYAAKAGHTHILEWISKKGYSIEDDYISICAAKSGKLDTMEWCIHNGYKWSTKATMFVIKGGHLDIVKWIVSNDYPHENICYYSYYFDKIDILGWCKDNACNCDDKYH